MEYKVNQGTKEYKLTIKLEGSTILFTLESLSGEIYSKSMTLDELKSVDQYFYSVQSETEAMTSVDTILRTEKVSVEGEFGSLQIVFYFSDGHKASITLESSSGLGIATTTTSTDAFLTTNTQYETTTESNYENIGEIQTVSTTEENFGNLDNIVPDPKLNVLQGKIINIDQILGVSNKTVTTTKVRKSIVPENTPIEIENTTITHEPVPVPINNESLPTITPADPIPEVNTIQTQSISPLKVLPTKYLPLKTLGTGENISQVLASINLNEQQESTDINIQTVATDYNIQETSNVQTTTDYNIQTTKTTTDYNVQTTTDYNVETNNDFNVESTDINAELVNINAQTTTDYNIQNTNEEANVQFTDINAQETADYNIPTSTEDANIESMLKPQLTTIFKQQQMTQMFNSLI